MLALLSPSTLELPRHTISPQRGGRALRAATSEASLSMRWKGSDQRHCPNAPGRICTAVSGLEGRKDRMELPHGRTVPGAGLEPATSALTIAFHVHL